MKISIITVCFNSAATVADTMRSVATQTHPEIEHIVIDGASNDETLAIVRSFPSRLSQLVSERDAGIYDAMNKGLRLATGELVGFLNSDDCYADSSVLSDVAAACRTAAADFVYGDVRMVNAAGQTVRDWKTGEVAQSGLNGSQIPHPSLFVRKRVLDAISPPFDPKYRIASDLKQQLIFINKHGARGAYVARALVIMRMGGTSTSSLSSYMTGWRECALAYNEVFGSGGVWFTAKKVLSKVRGLRKLA